MSGNHKVLSEKLVSVLESFDIELSISLTDENYLDLFGVGFDNISNLLKMKRAFEKEIAINKYGQKISLISLLSLKTNNDLINSILFINRSNFNKIPIRIISLSKPRLVEDYSFIYDIISSIFNLNSITIEYKQYYTIKPTLKFLINLIEDNKIIDTKTFMITNDITYIQPENAFTLSEILLNEEKIYYFKPKYEYFYTSLSELMKIIINENGMDFIYNLIEKIPKIKIVVIYDNLFIAQSKFINDIFNITNIFIFEKSELLTFINQGLGEKKDKKYITKNDRDTLENYFLNNIPISGNKKLKLGILIEKLNLINILQQDVQTKLMVTNKTYITDLVSIIFNEVKRTEYKNIILKNYEKLKDIFVGSFMNRYILGSSIETCCKASIDCIKKYIESLRIGITPPNEHEFYEVQDESERLRGKNKKIISNKKDSNFTKIDKLEKHFILDCTNQKESKIKDYNSLLDYNCIGYFSSSNNKNFLVKQGFIDKKGVILNDPDKKISSEVKNINNSFEKFRKDRSMKLSNELTKLYLKKEPYNSLLNQYPLDLKHQRNDSFAYLPKMNNHKSIDNKEFYTDIFNDKAINRQILKVKNLYKKCRNRNLSNNTKVKNCIKTKSEANALRSHCFIKMKSPDKKNTNEYINYNNIITKKSLLAEGNLNVEKYNASKNINFLYQNKYINKEMFKQVLDNTDKKIFDFEY